MPFSSVFATPTLAALLSLFALDPERVYYQRELVKLTGSSLYLVQRELKRLEKVGLISREHWGRQVRYRVNVHHSGFAGLRQALLNTVALANRLRAALAPIDAVKLAFIYGSIATGEATADSDVDVLVVGDIGLRDVAAGLVPALREIGREPNIVVLSPEELRERVARGEHFVATVLRGPRMWLVGDDNDLAATLA
ncbi:MAG: hypothetical protein Kow00122_18870 [Thermoleophilia bacterium]